MKAWIGTAQEQITGVVKKLITEHTKTIIFTGGFARCTFMLDSIKKAYKNDGITVIDDGKDQYGSADFSVARGGIARFSVEVSRAPFPYALLIPQDEHWSAAQHPDIDEDSGEIFSWPKVANAKEKWVANRAHTILPTGTMTTSQAPATHKTILELYLDEGDFAFEKCIYWTKSNISDHDALCPGGTLRTGIGLWKKIKFTLTGDQVKGLKLDRRRMPTKAIGKSFKVHIQRKLNIMFVVTVESMNCEIGVYMLPASWDLYETKVVDTNKQVAGTTVYGTEEIRRLRKAPSHEGMVHLAGTDFVMGDHYTELQRWEADDDVEMED